MGQARELPCSNALPEHQGASLTMPVPVDTSAPLPNVLLPALLQQGRALPIPDLAQSGLDGISPAGVEHHSTQVKRRCLKGSLEDIWNLHEDDVPHEQAKKGGPDAALCMRACAHRETVRYAMLANRSAICASKQKLHLMSQVCILVLQEVLQNGFTGLRSLELP